MTICYSVRAVNKGRKNRRTSNFHFAKDKTGPSLAWPTIFVPEHELNCQPAILYLPLSLAEVLKRFE